MYSTFGTHRHIDTNFVKLLDRLSIIGEWAQVKCGADPIAQALPIAIRHRLLCVYLTLLHVTKPPRLLPSMLTNEKWSQTGGWNEADYCRQSLSHSTKFDIWLMWWYYLAVVFVSHKLHVVSCQHACTCVHIFTSLNCIAWGTILECKVSSILGSERDKYSIFMHCLATFEESNIHWGRTTTTLHT